MKFKKVTVSIIVLVSIISISSICYAKYVFDYVEKVAEINIDRTPPTIRIEYSNKEPTNTNVEVKIIANEEIKEIDGWQLSEDKKCLSNIYDTNVDDVIKIEDLSGNQNNANVEINNIDKNSPIAEIIEITNTNKGYEKYSNKTHEIKMKVKISDDNEILIDNSQEFLILLDTKEAVCTKEIEVLEKNRNYIIYNITLTNILENGELMLRIPNNVIEDIVGNKMSEITLKTEIEIDNISPIVNYNQKILDDGKILATIESNEAVRNLMGWNSNSNNTINSKEFISDIDYQRDVTDFAGNVSKINIQIKGSTFLGLEVKSHVSRIGLINAENNFIGKIEKGNPTYKFESLLFRTSSNVDNDFLKVSGYMHTYWGENSQIKSGQYGIIYNYGYNPKSGYKTMANSELAMNNGKRYIHIGGEGANYQGATDINGKNPIPVEIAKQYKYGISGIKLDLKEHEKNSIIYQIFLSDIGWLKTCKNGEEAMKDKTKPIEAMRFAVIPTSELEFVIRDWNKNIGTYNLD